MLLGAANMDENAIRAALPDVLAARISALRVNGAAVTAVVDATGLDPAARDILEGEISGRLGELDGVDTVHVAMTAERTTRRIIAIGSGKGGVGKSTLTANLAVALARAGRKVGLVDADIYGPSQPTLLNAEGVKPVAREDKLVPVQTQWGVPMLSMGQLVEPGKAIAWRGPMSGGALGQLIDAQWGETELLLVDLPPGTGDIQLSMIQKHKPAGAIIVSTPQDLALIDAQRAADLFAVGKVPVVGLVENMAGYSCPHCGEISHPFGEGGVEQAADIAGLPFLGRIPLDMAIRSASDAGTPPAAGEGQQAEAFAAIARRVADWLDRGHA